MKKRDGQPVNVSHNNETGERQWAITCDDAWWMDAFPTRDEAVDHCNAMGWPIAFISSANNALTKPHEIHPQK